MPIDTHSNVFLFADDTKLSNRVPDIDNKIQQDLDLLCRWSEVWQLRFNADKCKVMHIGKQQQPQDYYMNTELGRVKLEVVHIEKDLGVNFDEGLVFKDHVLIQTQKCNKLLGMIRRCFTYLDLDNMPTLYKVIVRPHLEYCNVVWHPRYKRETELLEKVQRRATKLVPSIRKLPYHERLRYLKLPSLYYRRARGDMIECFKYVTGIYRTSYPILQLDNASSTRGNSLKLKKLPAMKATRSNFFSRRITNAWNRLPNDVVTSPNLNVFKNRLDKYWNCHWYCLDAEWFM